MMSRAEAIEDEIASSEPRRLAKRQRLLAMLLKRLPALPVPASWAASSSHPPMHMHNVLFLHYTVVGIRGSRIVPVLQPGAMT